MNAFRYTFKQRPVTISFIALSCFISCITWFGSVYSTLYWFVFDPVLISDGQLWRILTPIFLHFPAMGIIFAHMAFNMIWLHEFGTSIERAESSRFLFIFICISGIISNCAQAYFSYGIFGGMSGVIYALLGYLFVRSNVSRHYPYPVANNIAYFLIACMVLSALGVFGDGIANVSHVAGFFCGIITGFIRKNA